MPRHLASRTLASRRLGTDTRRDDRVDRYAPPPPDATPPVLSSVLASVLSTTSVLVTWTTDEPADSQVEYGADDTYGSSSTLNTTLSTDHAVTLTGLTPDATYHYRVLSRDVNGNLSASDDGTVTATIEDTTSPVVSSQTQATTDTTVTVHWRTDEPAKGRVEYGLTTALGNTTALESSFGVLHDVVITGLTPNTGYHYKSHSTDAAGNEFVSNDRTWTTQVGADVTAPVLSAISAVSTTPTGVIVSWTTNEASDSQVEYGLTTGYGSSTTLDATMVTSHSVAFGGLTAGTLYHYRVKSRDASGNLATSSDGTFTTVADAPSIWADSDPPSGTTTSAITLVTTEASLGYDVTFTEGATTLVLVTAEFRFSDGSGRRDALDGWPTRPTSGSKNVYGSVVELAAGTTYQIRLRFFWSDNTSSYRIGSATTRTISNVDPTTLTPTLYMDPVNGHDSGANNIGNPWKTYAFFAANYPTGGSARVKFLSNGNKVYLSASAQALNRGAVQMFTDAPAVSDLSIAASGPTGPTVALSTGGRVTIEPGAVTAPTGTVVADSWVTVAPWTSITLAGPGEYGNTPGTLYQVWRWTGAPVLNPTQGGYAATRDTFPPTRLACWTRDVTYLTTAAKFAEALYRNKYYRFGYWSDGAGTIYARLPGDVDPNTLWCWFGGVQGVRFNSSGSRLTGFAVHTFEYPVESTVACTVDHCALGNGFEYVRLTGSSAIRCLIERNLIKDTKMWTAGQSSVVDYTTIAWALVKGALTMQDGTITANKVAAHSETTGVYMASGSRENIVRNNTISGTFNGIGAVGAGSNSATRTNRDHDFHHNYLERIADDPFEPEGVGINIRIWRNTIRESITALSMAPIHYGPILFWRNTIWEIGSVGTGRAIDGTTGANGKAIKFDNSSLPGARFYCIHNSCDIDQNDPNLVMFAGDSGGGSTRHEKFWLRNNIITCTSYVIDSQELSPAGSYSEDYNFFCTTDTTRGIRLRAAEGNGALTDYDNTSGVLDFAHYRTASGQGAHSNLIDAVTKELNAANWLTDVRANWTNRATGDLSLVALAQAINRGVVVPNISDVPGTNYLGAAPDLGAIERE